MFIATSCHRANETVPIWLQAQAELGVLESGGTKRGLFGWSTPREKIMIRLLIAGAAVYVAYRI
ncbi:hypothetical protein, partial [Mesorhizobium sp.]|uniref:hypothetical protein n=1 Tax=Mesorhizobium sp. TaxID=1871066 RepID=UPI0025F04E1C